jgi:hypothetical protein
MQQLLTWIADRWPLVVSAAAIVGAVATFYERMQRVRELELKIAQLERARTQEDSRITIPTAKEIERYGRRRDAFIAAFATVMASVMAAAITAASVSIASGRRVRELERSTTQLREQLDEKTRERQELSNIVKMLAAEVQHLHRSGGVAMPTNSLRQIDRFSFTLLRCARSDAVVSCGIIITNLGAERTLRLRDAIAIDSHSKERRANRITLAAIVGGAAITVPEDISINATLQFSDATNITEFATLRVAVTIGSNVHSVEFRNVEIVASGENG